MVKPTVMVMAVVAVLGVVATGHGHTRDSATRAVCDGQLRIREYIHYDDAFNHMIQAWNIGSGVIVSEVNAEPWELRAYEYPEQGDLDGFYLQPSGVCARDGTIHIDEGKMRAKNKSQRRNVVAHEVGHALGIGHSYSGQLMNDYASSIEVPQGHDRADYRERWGPTRECPAVAEGAATCGQSLFGDSEPAPPLNLTPDLETVYDAVPDALSRTGATP
jgi:hypothetical protein